MRESNLIYSPDSASEFEAAKAKAAETKVP